MRSGGRAFADSTLTMVTGRHVLCAGALTLFGCVIPTAAVGQGVGFGVRAGMTLANVNVTDARQLPRELQWCCSPWDGTRMDATVGLIGMTELQPGFELSAELLFTRRGFRVEAGRHTPAAELRMSYLELPVLAHVVGDLVRVSGGMTFMSRTSVSQRTADISRDGTFVPVPSLARVDVGLVLGAGLHRGRWSLDGRYVHGLRNMIRRAPADAGLTHKSMMLIAGFRLSGSGCDPLPPPRAPIRR